MPKRVLISYCVDVDACAGWLNTTTGKAANPTDVSRGVFGANIGTDRLLKFFGDRKIKASWFMPSHSILTFPKQMAKVRDSGHEIGLHGYCHEYVGQLTEEQERKVMKKSIEVYEEFTGHHPKGWTAPAWSTSPHSMQILEDFGISYDHSLMHHDCQPYWASDVTEDSVTHTNYAADPTTWMMPMLQNPVRDVVEIPANWNLDDWPPMHFNMRNPGTHGYVNPDDVLKQWQNQFRFYYREYDSFIFPISIHPQVSGKSNLILMHEELFDFMKSHQGIEFVTAAQICDEFRAGTLAGHTAFELGATLKEKI